MKPTLYLMVGDPGSGKTTIAQMISKLAPAHHIWADKIRAETVGKQPTWRYAENRALHQKLNTKTKQLLQAGESVVFDTNFNHLRDRKKLRHLAEKCGARTVLVWVQTPVALAKARATDSSDQSKRVFGNMSPEQFEKIHHKMEAPGSNEQPVILSGSNVTVDYVQQKLGLQ